MIQVGVILPIAAILFEFSQSDLVHDQSFQDQTTQNALACFKGRYQIKKPLLLLLTTSFLLVQIGSRWFACGLSFNV